jgi:hypothetical protein
VYRREVNKSRRFCSDTSAANATTELPVTAANSPVLGIGKRSCLASAAASPSPRNISLAIADRSSVVMVNPCLQFVGLLPSFTSRSTAQMSLRLAGNQPFQGHILWPARARIPAVDPCGFPASGRGLPEKTTGHAGHRHGSSRSPAPYATHVPLRPERSLRGRRAPAADLFERPAEELLVLGTICLLAGRTAGKRQACCRARGAQSEDASVSSRSRWRSGSTSPPALAPWSIPEVRRLMELVLPLPAYSPEFRWAWSMWRRRKRAQARASYYRRRYDRPLARAPDP